MWKTIYFVLEETMREYHGLRDREDLINKTWKIQS